MRLMRRLSPAMADKGEGYHIILSSSAGKHANPKQCAYAGAKWGMTGFGLSAAKVIATTGLSEMWYIDVDNSRIENVCEQQLGSCGASLILLSRPLLSNSIGAGGVIQAEIVRRKPHHSRLSQACQHGF